VSEFVFAAEELPPKPVAALAVHSTESRRQDPWRTVEIRSVEQLEQLTGRKLPAAEHEAVQRVLDQHPARLTGHLTQLVRCSPAVAAQYLPDPRELEGPGETDPFVGLIPTGVRGVERLYLDRCVVMPVARCPAHCRFCFRRHHRHRRPDARPLDQEELTAALAYVAGDRRLREVLVTGGEPILDRRRLERLLAGLRQPGMEHVGPLRVACRTLASAPGLIDAELVALLARHQDLRAGRPVEVAAHLNHPDEIGPATVDALIRLREAGLHVYNQVVLLRGINSEAAVMADLLWMLRRRGVETYAIFFGEPVLGGDHLRANLAQARALKSELRRGGSGRCNPHLIVTTRVGKVELDVDGWEVEREADGRTVWLRTPYTLEGFRSLDPRFELPQGARVDDAGCIEVRYLDGPR